MAMSLQDLLAAIYGRQGMSPISQGFSPATRMPQGGRRGDARLGPRPLNPRPRPPMKPPVRPMPGTPGSGPYEAVPLPRNTSEDPPTMVPLGGGIQNRSFRMNPDMQAIIEAAARGRQRGNAPQARAQRFMRSDPSQMLGMVQR